MTNHQPITPPIELVQQWTSDKDYDERDWLYELHIATQAAQWGADQELEACKEWLCAVERWKTVADRLRSNRRPKPPSLKEQALEQLDGIATCFRVFHMCDLVCDKIRRALEQLDD